MSFLTVKELPSYYPTAASMFVDDVTRFLHRANSYAFGVIGGVPKYTEQLPAEHLKTAVALAFEILAEGQKAEVNAVNGFITEAAPTGHYVRKADDPLDVVEQMLLPYKRAFEAQNATNADNGVQFF
ncbi:hypothetical protein [Lysinibacillus sp. 54212]|uniref:hypothetical protein n=1 Tax=Lysinibacillus sp. 54212 TaxID=3119829 RepID=UPI002FC6A41D